MPFFKSNWIVARRLYKNVQSIRSTALERVLLTRMLQANDQWSSEIVDRASVTEAVDRVRFPIGSNQSQYNWYLQFPCLTYVQQ